MPIILLRPLNLIAQHEALDARASEAKLARVSVGIRVAPMVAFCHPAPGLVSVGVERPRVEKGADGFVVVVGDEPGGDLVLGLVVAVHVASGGGEGEARVEGKGAVFNVEVFCRIECGVGGFARVEMRCAGEDAAGGVGEGVDFAMDAPYALHACEDGGGDEARVFSRRFDQLGDFLHDLFGLRSGVCALVARGKGWSSLLLAKCRVVACKTCFSCKLFQQANVV